MRLLNCSLPGPCSMKQSPSGRTVRGEERLPPEKRDPPWSAGISANPFVLPSHGELQTTGSKIRTDGTSRTRDRPKAVGPEVSRSYERKRHLEVGSKHLGWKLVSCGLLDRPHQVKVDLAFDARDSGVSVELPDHPVRDVRP